MSDQSLPEDLSLEIKRIEKQIKEAHHHIKNELNGAPRLFDTSEAKKEVRALNVRLQELKQRQAKLAR